MARWDDEMIRPMAPPEDTLCHTCKFKLKPVLVGGFTQDRSGYAVCDKFDPKPFDINWGKVPCPEYEVQDDESSV